MANRWREFIEDSKGVGSSARLNMLIGVIVGSLVVILLAIKCELSGEIFAAYMLTTGGVYSFGKWRETPVKKEHKEDDKDACN